MAPSRALIAALIGPVLLAVVAFTQVYVAHCCALSPWKGGGFGMFSTIESPASRVVRAYLVSGGRRIAVPIPTQFLDREHAIRTMPSSGRLEELARALAKESWVPLRLVRADSRYEELRMKYRRESNSDSASPQAPLEPLNRDQNDAISLETLGMFRPTSRPSVFETPLDIQRVDAEVWQLSLADGGRRLTARVLYVASVTL